MNNGGKPFAQSGTNQDAIANEPGFADHLLTTPVPEAFPKCSKCGDTGYTDHAGFALDPCPHDPTLIDGGRPAADGAVTLAACPPGLFTFNGTLCLKTEYGKIETVGPTEIPGSEIRWTVGKNPDAYVAATGEFFWGGAKTHAERDRLMVKPVPTSADEVTLVEAAADLLAAKDHDYRTVGYREDLWNCLRDIMAAPTGSEPVAPARELPDFLTELRSVNGDRYVAWTGGTEEDPLYMSNEFGGEAGEVQNVVKKLVREQRGWVGSRSSVEALGDEIGDCIICLDSVARAYGLDLAEVTAAKFNKTSAANGFPHHL